MANVVFKTKASKRSMNQEQLGLAFGGFEPYEMERIKGNLCGCNGNGQFVLLPVNHEAVVEGGKAYMRCRICDGWSHL